MCDHRGRQFHGRLSAGYQVIKLCSLTQFNKLEASEVGRLKLQRQAKSESPRDTEGCRYQSGVQRSKILELHLLEQQQEKRSRSRCFMRAFPLPSVLPPCCMVPMSLSSIITCRSSLETPTNKLRSNTWNF